MASPQESQESQEISDYEALRFERVAEQTRLKVSRDPARDRVRIDLVDPEDDVLARVYLGYERARKLAKIIAAAVPYGGAIP